MAVKYSFGLQKFKILSLFLKSLNSEDSLQFLKNKASLLLFLHVEEQFCETPELTIRVTECEAASAGSGCGQAPLCACRQAWQYSHASTEGYLC